jgi:hypothetical protein
MTSQTQKFIEVKDILAFRFQCKCGSMVVTPIKDYKEMPIACSNCGYQFAPFENYTIQQTFKNVITTIQRAQQIAEDRGFSFSLEITNEPKQNAE